MANDIVRTAVYPGSFDPLTNGHVSLVRRGLKLFDRVIVAVARNSRKTALFTVEERMAMARETFSRYPAVEVDTFDGLTVEYAESKGAAILRGMRAVSDFEMEFQLALMNRRLNRTVQTVFLMTDYKWLYISSTIIKEAASLGGDIRGLVPENVARALRAKFDQRARGE